MKSFIDFLSESQYETQDRKQRVCRQKHEKKLEKADVTETEELSEISRERALSYYDKAIKDLSSLSAKKRSSEKQMTNRIRSGKTLKNYKPKDELSKDEARKYRNRNKWTTKTRFKHIYSESEELSEISNERLSDYIEKANKDRLKLGQAHPKHFKRILGMYKASSILKRKKEEGSKYNPKVSPDKRYGKESKYYNDTTK